MNLSPAETTKAGRPQSNWRLYLPGLLGVVLILAGCLGWALFEFGSIRYAWLYASGVRVFIEPRDVSLSTSKGGATTQRLIFHASNLGGAPMQILGSESSCTCLFLEGLPVTIPPGGRAELHVAVENDRPLTNPVEVRASYLTDHPTDPRLTVTVRLIPPSDVVP